MLLRVPIYPVGGGVRMFAAQLPFVQHEKPSADQPETTIDFFNYNIYVRPMLNQPSFRTARVQSL